jgi:hypothetical protein
MSAASWAKAVHSGHRYKGFGIKLHCVLCGFNSTLAGHLGQASVTGYCKRMEWMSGGTLTRAVLNLVAATRCFLLSSNVLSPNALLLAARFVQPTFVVTAMDRPLEPLVAKSCTGCWSQACGGGECRVRLASRFAERASRIWGRALVQTFAWT